MQCGRCLPLGPKVLACGNPGSHGTKDSGIEGKGGNGDEADSERLSHVPQRLEKFGLLTLTEVDG